MLTQGTRITLAAIVASAIGLSCAGCLGTSSLQHASKQTNYTQYSDNASPDLIRTMPVRKSQTVGIDTSQRQQLQQTLPAASGFQFGNYATSNGHTPVHPLGRTSGIDIAVAEFAQSNSNASPIRYEREWLPAERREIGADYTFVANTQRTGLGLDLAVQPRVSFRSDGDIKTTRAGAEIRVGQNLDKRGKNVRNSNWYFFAGADGEAVVWDVNHAGSNFTDGPLSLQDKVTIGDVQAGIAWESPAGQMSFSYIEREYEYRNGEIARSGDENFVALTLSWKR